MTFSTKIFAVTLLAFSFTSLMGCGGGGGDSGSSTGSVSGDRWLVLAIVSKNGCGERISNVQQTFTVGSGQVDTSLATVPVTDIQAGFEFSYSETNGECTRVYTGSFSNVSGSTANVELVSDSTCATVQCQNVWTGTASKI